MVFKLKDDGLKNADIANQLKISPQRVHSVIKRARTKEQIRGLGAASATKASRISAKPRGTFPAWLFPFVSGPCQAIRNTCFEYGFRIYLVHNYLKSAIEEVCGIVVPIRTLRRYRFDSAIIHYFPESESNVSRNIPLSPESQVRINNGVPFRQLLGQAICRHHEIQECINHHGIPKCLVEDRRNRLVELLTKHGTFIHSGSGFLVMPFWHWRATPSNTQIPRNNFKQHVKEYFEVAKSVKQCILDLIHDERLELVPQRNRREIISYFESYLELVSSPSYIKVTRLRDRDRQLVKVGIGIRDYDAGFNLGLLNKSNTKFNKDVLGQIGRVIKRILETPTDLPPLLAGLNPGQIHEHKKKLLNALMLHGWDSCRHPGNPENNQLHFHR